MGSAYALWMRRVVIVGNSGSGKTTLADEVAERLGVPHVELDAHFHLAGWKPATPEQFAGTVRAALDAADAASDGWVVCGNYPAVRTSIWARADTIVWLDLPRHVVMARVLRRTADRAIRRTELWNGNRESPGNALALHDPERSIIRWAWDGVDRYRRQYAGMLTDPTWAGLRRHRLRSSEEVAGWLDGDVAQRATA